MGCEHGEKWPGTRESPKRLIKSTITAGLSGSTSSTDNRCKHSWDPYPETVDEGHRLRICGTFMQIVQRGDFGRTRTKNQVQGCGSGLCGKSPVQPHHNNQQQDRQPHQTTNKRLQERGPLQGGQESFTSLGLQGPTEDGHPTRRKDPRLASVWHPIFCHTKL